MMCKPGSGTIFRQCFEHALKEQGVTHMANKEMRRVLISNGGCMAKTAKPLDIKTTM